MGKAFLSGDGAARAGLGGLATLMGSTGVGILAPSLKDALLAFLDRTLSLNLYNAPAWVGALLIVAAVMLYIPTFFGPTRVWSWIEYGTGMSRATVGSLLAIKQTGFLPNVPDLRSEELPQSLRRRSVSTLRIDVADDLAAQPPDLQRALARQLRMPDDLQALRSGMPESQLAYCGIVQAPFQFLAGFQLSGWAHVLPFEWMAAEARWESLAQGDGPDLGIAMRGEPLNGRDIAIAIEVSYPISTGDILASVPDLAEIVRIGPGRPLLRCITHQRQVAQLAGLFREALDEVHRRRFPDQHIHVFCAAQMSVGFALGRQISRTLHPPVTVYAYAAQQRPPYSWGVLLNPAHGAPQIVKL